MAALPRLRSGTSGARGSRSSRSLPGWPVLRRRLLLLLGLVILLAGAYHFWFRSSSLVAVDEVAITGAEQYPAIESSLRSAALGQTTLNFDAGALAAAVAAEPEVRSVSAEPDFPHAANVEVELREPVAVLSDGTLVAGDGILLGRGKDTAAALPTLELEMGSGRGGGSLSGDRARIAKVLGAAPGPLLAEAGNASVETEYGVVVELTGGLELRFGGAEDAARKWLAAAAVLADPDLGQPAYIDLTFAARPVAGGLAKSPDAGEGAAAAPAEALPAEPVTGGEAASVTPSEGTETAPPAAPEVTSEGGLATVE